MPRSQGGNCHEIDVHAIEAHSYSGHRRILYTSLGPGCGGLSIYRAMGGAGGGAYYTTLASQLAPYTDALPAMPRRNDIKLIHSYFFPDI